MDKKEYDEVFLEGFWNGVGYAIEELQKEMEEDPEGFSFEGSMLATELQMWIEGKSDE